VTEFAGWNSGGYGNLVVVRHRLGYTTWYAHLSVITTWVGESVTGGTRLGYVGSTGHATGPHLHFELRRNAVPIDPVPYLLAAVATRASSARTASGGGAPTGGGTQTAGTSAGGTPTAGGTSAGGTPTAGSSAGGGGAGVENGSGEGGGSASGGGHTGGGVAARECPIRKPLVRYRKAPLDACKAKNLTRAR
jgi:hypothetical protein